MMKMLICLLAMLCMLPAAQAEEGVPIELGIVLSQTMLEGPQSVDVTVTVTNVSGADMPGPLALYTPDGRIIEEFGTPTLLAGESRAWQGTWNVTETQLNQGRVIFAIKYAFLQAEGKLVFKTQPFYTRVLQADIVLAGNPTTGYSWKYETTSGEKLVDVLMHYFPDRKNDNEDGILLAGGGGKYYVHLTGIAPGEETITFTYCRPWEEAAPLYTLVYHVRVDEALNVVILSNSFDW